MQTSLNEQARKRELAENEAIFLGLAICFYTFLLTLNWLFLPLLNSSHIEGRLNIELPTLFTLSTSLSFMAGILAYFWLKRISWQVMALGAGVLLLISQLLASFATNQVVLLTTYLVNGLATGTLEVLFFVSAGISQQRVRLFACLGLGALLAGLAYPFLAYLLSNYLHHQIYYWTMTALSLVSLALSPAFSSPNRLKQSNTHALSLTPQPTLLLIAGISAICLFSLATNLSYQATNFIFITRSANEAQLPWLNWAYVFVMVAELTSIMVVLILGEYVKTRSVLIAGYSLLIISFLLLVTLNLFNLSSTALLVIFAIIIHCSLSFIKPLLFASIARLQVNPSLLNTLYLAMTFGFLLGSILQNTAIDQKTLSILVIISLLVMSLVSYLLSQTRAQKNKNE